jgi:hypothetical protein
LNGGEVVGGVDPRLLDWINERGLVWSESLPYSFQCGWTDPYGNFSIIYNGDKTESFETVKSRYEAVIAS